ncbi:MAG: ATP-grasp domain-containing protein [Methylococcales bacterium]
MKILVFEYITGGGFNKQELPDALLREGRLMLQALLDNLSVIPGVEVQLMLDSRCWRLINTMGIHTRLIQPRHDCLEEFKQLAQHCDAVWPIAPESDGILHNLCRLVETLGITLLNSSSTAVAITGNKLATHQQLMQQGIASVPTERFDAEKYYPVAEWMLKPIDGVGCVDSYVLNDPQHAKQLSKTVAYVIQPHLTGKKTSLSCLCKSGTAWLLSVNLQQFTLSNQQYQLSAITVNEQFEPKTYQLLAAKIAEAFPELWGYVGIDLIETAERVWVLEINPRLTSSFIGLYEALGINAAELVLQLINGEPNIVFTRQQAITINLKQDANG